MLRCSLFAPKHTQQPGFRANHQPKKHSRGLYPAPAGSLLQHALRLDRLVIYGEVSLQTTPDTLYAAASYASVLAFCAEAHSATRLQGKPPAQEAQQGILSGACRQLASACFTP
jgi:hypothetical protein